MDDAAKLSVAVSKADHLQGDPKSRIVLVEYGDYECSHCGRAYGVLKAVQKALGKDLCFVFRNFPLKQIHPHAEMAAEAAEAADAQGRFWEMHDLLYENQENLSPNLIIELARQLKLDLARFESDLEGRKFQAKVRQDFMGGVRSGVNGTPSFFVNGIRYDGPWEPPELFIAGLAD